MAWVAKFWVATDWVEKSWVEKFLGCKGWVETSWVVQSWVKQACSQQCELFSRNILQVKVNFSFFYTVHLSTKADAGRLVAFISVGSTSKC